MKTYDMISKNRPSGSIRTKIYDGKPYRDGEFFSNYGIVRVYSQANPNHSTFSMIINGFYVSRSVNKYYTEIGLARIANKYAKEMHDKLILK